MESIGKTLTSQKGKRYKIYEKIGSGAIATVYKGFELGEKGRDVAVKVVHPHLSEERDRFLSRFEAEAQLLSRLNADHIVRILDYDEDQGLKFIVMEFVEGETLAERIAQRQKEERSYSIDETLRIMRQVAQGLQEAVNAQVIAHRDLKPHNLVITPDGTVKILDFGIAKSVEQTGKTLTELLGTPAYMSPEQFEDSKTVDIRTDIYSLGCIAYQMLMFELPYGGGTAQEIMRKLWQEPVPLVDREDMSSEVKGLIARCMAKQRSERPASPGELIRLIDIITDTYSPRLEGSEGGSDEAFSSIVAQETLTRLSAEVEQLRQKLQSVDAEAKRTREQVTRLQSQLAALSSGAGSGWRGGISPVIAGLLFVLMVIVGIIGACLPRPAAPALSAPSGLSSSNPGNEQAGEPNSSEAVTVISTPTNTPIPTPTNTPSPIPIDTPTSESAISDPGDDQSSSHTTGVSPTVTNTPLPSPTDTPTSTPLSATSTSTATPTPTKPAVARPPTATHTPAAPTGRFTLLKPTLDSTSTGPTEFEWRWDGPVGADQGFEVRVWREGEPPAGTHNAVEDNLNGSVAAVSNNTYRVTINIRDAAGVRGRGGEYLWTVVLVQISPEYKDLGIQAPPGRLRLGLGGGGGGGDGGGGGGGGGFQ